MRLTNEEVEEFRQLYLSNEYVKLTSDEARDMLSRVGFLFERFTQWVAKEEAAGRVFDYDETPPVAKDGRSLQ
jgi:hypothetical protein